MRMRYAGNMFGRREVSRMWSRCANAVLFSGCLVTWTSTARGESNSCPSAYEQAQELRAAGRLREARHKLEVCVAPACSEFVRAECSRWLVEVEASLPSVVLVAKRAGKEADNVRVFCDDEPLVENLDGKAIVVDPGPHTLRFLISGMDPVSENLVFREGEKNRLITVEFASNVQPAVVSPGSPPIDAAKPTTQTTKWLPYGLGGLGVLGVAGFAVLGLVGNSELAERERTCAPACSNSQVGSVRTMYHLADLSLGIGVVSLGVAGYLLITSPRESMPRGTARAPELDVHFLQGGGYAALRAHF
jgi:hypothetical protein